ncbi:hypothetical protein [Streptosporangium sandarakinum]|uniref:Uncharacterized protein n=1 Tax=Streptosporangium sandarakinum TaxID=1260955 RepID=A0A852VEP0_9ACTN|nr:hypothetical protein [Streptosporangium sandarakinum]NYF44675.1 hypothetical protein [Streptosporangium sandarakinum]
MESGIWWRAGFAAGVLLGAALLMLLSWARPREFVPAGPLTPRVVGE